MVEDGSYFAKVGRKKVSASSAVLDDGSSSDGKAGQQGEVSQFSGEVSSVPGSPVSQMLEMNVVFWRPGWSFWRPGWYFWILPSW